jgi:hypothetical protein
LTSPRTLIVDLARAQSLLASGSRSTTYLPRRLLAALPDAPIPQRSGLGWPEPDLVEGLSAAGFLANAAASGQSALFDPYSFSVEDPAFEPPRVAYWVSNVPVSGDARRWCYVYSRDESGMLRINNVDTSDIFGAFHWPASVEPNSVPYSVPSSTWPRRSTRLASGVWTDTFPCGSPGATTSNCPALAGSGTSVGIVTRKT